MLYKTHVVDAFSFVMVVIFSILIDGHI